VSLPRRIEHFADNDLIHLKLLSKIIPAFASEARERGLDISGRKIALQGILETHTAPLDRSGLGGTGCVGADPEVFGMFGASVAEIPGSTPVFK